MLLCFEPSINEYAGYDDSDLYLLGLKLGAPTGKEQQLGMEAWMLAELRPGIRFPFRGYFLCMIQDDHRHVCDELDSKKCSW